VANFNLTIGRHVDALGQPDRVDSTFIDRLLTKLGDKLSLLSAPGGVDREFNIEAHAVETILNAVRGSVPCVIVDVPNLWAPWIKHTLVHADQVIITRRGAGSRNTKIWSTCKAAPRPAATGRDQSIRRSSADSSQ
jgi:Flp pilus assembly CpaE family ATPase